MVVGTTPTVAAYNTYGCRLLSLLLVELDGVSARRGPPVILLGAAPSPDDLDPAILRPGRLDVHVR